jgi:uncharacterized protein YjiS (DUF1127 family)
MLQKLSNVALEPGLQVRKARPLLTTLWQAFWTARERRKAVEDLRGLPDRMLADMGVDRSEIESVVYGRGDDPTRLRR